MNYVERHTNHLLEKVEDRNGNSLFIDKNAKYPTMVICSDNSPMLIPTGQFSRQQARA